MVSKTVDRFNDPLDVNTLDFLSPHSQLLFALDCAKRILDKCTPEECFKDASPESTLKCTVENFLKYFAADPNPICHDTCKKLASFLRIVVARISEDVDSEPPILGLSGILGDVCRIAYTLTSIDNCPTKAEHADERKWQNERILHYKSEE